MTYKILFAVAMMVPFGAGIARADRDDCYVPMANWQPRGAVQAMAEAKGWTVRRIKTHDGCYEIKGRDETGCEVEAEVDPATLKILKLERETDCKLVDDDEKAEDGEGTPPVVVK